MDAKRCLKQMTPGPLIPVQSSPAWSCTCILGPSLVPVSEGSAQRRWGSQPHPSPRERRQPKAHPAATFIPSLLYIKEPQRRSKRSEVFLAQSEVLSEGDTLLSAAPDCGDRVIPIAATSLSHLVGSVDLCHCLAPRSHTGPHPGAWVCRAPLPLAEVLPGLLLLGIACSCPWMEGDGSAWRSGGTESWGG